MTIVRNFEAVATTKLASLELENNDDRPKLVDMCTQVHSPQLASLELVNNDDRPKLVDMCTQVHMSVGVVADDFWDVMRRKVYTTPKSRRAKA